MNILLVEDSAEKIEQIQQLITDRNYDVKLAVVNDFSAACKAMKEQRFDLLILDICLPMREGAKVQSDGGILLLKELRRRQDLLVPFHVVGLTEHEDAALAGKELFDELTWSLLLYNRASNYWREQIINKVEHVTASENSDDVDYGCDLLLLVALQDPELKAVLKIFPELSRLPPDGDPTQYYKATLQFNGVEKPQQMVAASAIEMGMPAATALAVKGCLKFRPKYVGMVGICAGIGLNYGDIVVAERCWDYGSGKYVEGDDGEMGDSKFEPAPTSIVVNSYVDEISKVCVADKGLLKQIENEWEGQRAETGLSAAKAPMASGASVLADRNIISRIRDSDRKVKAVEMEAYGVFLAGRVCPAPQPRIFVVKSVCDHGDGNKDDKWQSYAAYTSAAFARYLFKSLAAISD